MVMRVRGAISGVSQNVSLLRGGSPAGRSSKAQKKKTSSAMLLLLDKAAHQCTNKVVAIETQHPPRGKYVVTDLLGLPAEVIVAGLIGQNCSGSSDRRLC